MGTIKFEDVLKECNEKLRQDEDYKKAYKAAVNAIVCDLLLKRHPRADPNMTIADLVDAAEMAEVVREAETMAEALMKSEIEQAAREAYRRLVSAIEPPATKQ